MQRLKNASKGPKAGSGQGRGVSPGSPTTALHTRAAHALSWGILWRSGSLLHFCEGLGDGEETQIMESTLWIPHHSGRPSG